MQDVSLCRSLKRECRLFEGGLQGKKHNLYLASREGYLGFGETDEMATMKDAMVSYRAGTQGCRAGRTGQS